MIKIIHLIDKLSAGNHGIVEAALGTANDLLERFDYTTELWFPTEHVKPDHSLNLRGVTRREVQSTLLKSVDGLALEYGLTPNQAIIMTHGCWRWPTLAGAQLKRAGFHWIYNPHGMLEPWSLSQRKLEKMIYWNLREGPLARRADMVRASSLPEEKNLKKKFQNVRLIPHGIKLPKDAISPESNETMRFLFLGRFHAKKNPSLLVRAWRNSRLCSNAKFELILVGNDDGDLKNIQDALGTPQPANVKLYDPIYGEKKEQLFKTCHFFILPSQSEGFPMALIEGMANGLIPVITQGCNFPEAIESGVGISIEPEVESISAMLNSIENFSFEKIMNRQIASQTFIRDNYSLEEIARKKAELFQELLA